MNITCAWCGKKLGEKDGQGVEGDSHSICDQCLNLYFPHHADKIKKSLEVKNIEEIYKEKDNTLPDHR